MVKNHKYATAYYDEQERFYDYIEQLTARCTDEVEAYGRIVAFCVTALYRLNRYMDMLGTDTSQRIMDAVDDVERENKKKKSNVIPFKTVRKPKGVN